MNYKVIKVENKLSYKDGLDLQHKAFDLVEAEVFEGILLILEHNHVLTMGIRTDNNNLLVSEILETPLLIRVEPYRSLAYDWK